MANMDSPPEYDSESSKLISTSSAPVPSEPSASHWSSASTSNCMDWPYALLFLGNTGFLCVLLASHYDASYFTTAPAANSAAADAAKTANPDAIWAVGLALGMGVLFSMLWMAALQTCPRTLIQAGLLFAIAMPAVSAVMALLAGQVLMFIIMAICAAAGVCWFFYVQSRIALAATMLSIASKFVQEYPSLICVSLGSMAVSIAYMVLWALTSFCLLMSIGAINNKAPGSGYDSGTVENQAKAGLPLMFYLFLSYFWGLNVFANTLHVTTSGAFCEWWFESEQTQNKNKVFTSLYRASTSSFGSICYGSLLISIVQALEAIVRQSRREDPDESAIMCFLRCCAICILQCIEGWMQFMNTYAFVHVALYGDDFCTAGKKTWDLISSSGFDMIINEDLTQMALTVSAVGGAILGGGATYLVAVGTMDINQPTAAGLGAMGGVITFGCMLMIMSLAMSVVASIYVCYCEKPAEGATNHPEEFNELVQGWREAYSGLRWYQDSSRGNTWVIRGSDNDVA